MRILVVDDDPMAGELTGAILEGLGHEVVLAEDGVDALEKLDADEGKWVNALKKPRKALEKATADFLHAVSAAQDQGDLTEPQYEKLVADLRARRTALLEQALAAVADA